MTGRLKRTVNKALKIVIMLSRLMHKNIAELRICKRRSMMSVVHRFMLFGFKIWTDTFKVRYYSVA